MNPAARFLALEPARRDLLIEQAAIGQAISPVIMEKDFWVCWLLGGLDRLIAKKRDLKQTAMQQLLTGRTRLVDNGTPAGASQT